jgi:predicted homoserine dehydrogenase-like protein
MNAPPASQPQWGALPLHEALAAREKAGKPIRIGLIGAGQMGTDILVQVAQMQGIEVAAVADRDPERVRVAAAHAERREDVRAVEGGLEIANAIQAGKIAATTSPEAVCASEAIDVIIDATGSPDAGARVALTAIAAKKHVVMMNVEADVTAGAYFAAEAAKAGIVYTIGAGDEPSSTMELIRFVQAMGYPIIAAGKGKNNPFRIEAMPEHYRAEAARRNMNPRMLVEFVDGSKTAVEMVAIANATGMRPDIPGMHGPTAPLEALQEVFCPIEEGGILHRKGVVDFSVAKGVAPGVFVIAEMRHPRVIERMNDLHLKGGPYFCFYRPFHLTSLEVPISAANAVLFGQSHMKPLRTPTADVGCVAKRDIAIGEVLDRIGETCYRGFALEKSDAQTRRAVPLGLAQGAKVVAPIARGELITLGAVELDRSTSIYAAREAQNAMIRG